MINSLLAQNPGLSGDWSLSESLAKADIAFGYETQALVEHLHAICQALVQFLHGDDMWLPHNSLRHLSQTKKMNYCSRWHVDTPNTHFRWVVHVIILINSRR